MPFSGHLNPMTTLARKLQSRGHEVVFVSVLDTEAKIRVAGLNFVPFCEKEYPAGVVTRLLSDAARWTGMDVITQWYAGFVSSFTQASLEHLPEALAKTGVEALVIDGSYRGLELGAMHLRVPYVQVWNALHMDPTGATPVCLFDWPYDPTPEGRARNLEGLRSMAEIAAPMRAVGMAYADKVGMHIDWSDRFATASRLAVITQIPKEFDFPGIPWPAQFHYAGPFHDDEGREPVPFPWERLTGKPLIYASLGTLVNGIENIYRTILQAAGSLSDIQMVLSIGRNMKLEDLGPIPSNTIAVPSAPQIDLLKRAELCITHAGLNTALETLAKGVPMVAIPIAFDQPGVASRIAYHGVGEFLNFDNLTVEALSALIQKVRTNPSYKAKALNFRRVIAQNRGLDVAADVLEEAFRKARTHVSQPHV